MTDIQVKRHEGVATLRNDDQASLNITEFDPSDLLAGALAKCTGHEVSKLARRKGYDLQDFSIRVELDRDRDTKTAHFVVHLDLEGDLKDNELKNLHKAAKKSYINRLLSHNIELRGDVQYNGQRITFE